MQTSLFSRPSTDGRNEGRNGWAIRIDFCCPRCCSAPQAHAAKTSEQGLFATRSQQKQRQRASENTPRAELFIWLHKKRGKNKKTYGLKKEQNRHGSFIHPSINPYFIYGGHLAFISLPSRWIGSATPTPTPTPTPPRPESRSKEGKSKSTHER